MRSSSARGSKSYGTVVAAAVVAAGCALSPLCIRECRAEDSVTETIADSLKGDWGQIKLNLRYRYEHVQQDGLLDGEADPLRLKLGYLSPEYAGFQGYIEGIGNTTIFFDDYNDTVSGDKEAYSSIADPEETELNQLWVSWEPVEETVVKGGRQRLLYDNGRFVHTQAFRQLEQTFDAASVFSKTLGNFSVNAAYVFGVLDVKANEKDMQTPLLNLKYSFPGIGALTGYGYWLDYDDAEDSQSFMYSTQTMGVRFVGKAAVQEDFSLLYEAEYAHQSDYGDNPTAFDADYYHLNGGVFFPLAGSLIKKVTAKIGYEVLGSDNGVPFQTPLGANHKFNGWADIFGKNKPAGGLQDLYGSLGMGIGPVTLDLVYHTFQADAGDSDYGTEFDVKLSWTIQEHYTLAASLATYDADEYKQDTEKIWLELIVDF